MKTPRSSAAPLIAAVLLLLLPALYVASYLALVVPQGRVALVRVFGQGQSFSVVQTFHYRYDGSWISRTYWPLEQIDRKVRPGAWGPDWDGVEISNQLLPSWPATPTTTSPASP